MIDLPPQMPPVPENIAQALAECGVRAGEFTITYDDVLQGNVIKFSAQSGVTTENMECIWRATWPDFPEFADATLQEAYAAIGQSYFDAHFKGQVIASARGRLEQRGLLDTLPQKNDFPNREDFAAALEQHCGFERRTILRVEGDTFTVWPQTEVASYSAPEFEKFACLFAALTLAAEDDSGLKIGLIGNEKFRETDSDYPQTH
ncbi:MAG: hypothetical protein J7493_10370 [Porphyrobacter sp.]|nr:hypothetical protein [Porphyrobacter sp.]